ncbi:MAG: hypothetical protein ACLR2G_11850 [Phascolarctobacterium faecium]
MHDHLSKQAEKLGLPVPELYMSAAVLILPGRPWSVPTLCGMSPQAVVP